MNTISKKVIQEKKTLNFIQVLAKDAPPNFIFGYWQYIQGKYVTGSSQPLLTLRYLTFWLIGIASHIYWNLIEKNNFNGHHIYPVREL